MKMQQPKTGAGEQYNSFSNLRLLLKNMNKQNFRDILYQEIEKRLIKEFDSFISACMLFIEQNCKSYKRIVLANIPVKMPLNDTGITPYSDFLIGTIKEKESIRFKRKEAGYRRDWLTNEIIFPFSSKMSQLPVWGTSEYFHALRKRDQLEVQCENEFWSIKDNENAYHSVIKPLLFSDESIERKSENRLLYIHKLIEYYYPEFRYSKVFSTKKEKRFVLEINNNLWLGLQYREAEIIKKSTNGDIILPDHFELVLIIRSGITGKNITNNNLEWNLGILGNPFFYPPCYPLEGFSALISTSNFNYTNDFTATDIPPIEFQKPKNYNALLSKHAFFYMDLLSSTSNSYIDYLKNTLTNLSFPPSFDSNRTNK